MRTLGSNYESSNNRERSVTAKFGLDFHRGVTLANELVGADGIEPPTAGV